MRIPNPGWCFKKNIKESPSFYTDFQENMKFPSDNFLFLSNKDNERVLRFMELFSSSRIQRVERVFIILKGAKSEFLKIIIIIIIINLLCPQRDSTE